MPPGDTDGTHEAGRARGFREGRRRLDRGGSCDGSACLTQRARVDGAEPRAAAARKAEVEGDRRALVDHEHARGVAELEHLAGRGGGGGGGRGVTVPIKAWLGSSFFVLCHILSLFVFVLLANSIIHAEKSKMS